MWQQEFLWFFTIFHHEFRKNNGVAFETLMVLAVAHLFGFYNPKQLADFLEVPHQQFYSVLKDWSVYHVKKMLLRFMVKQAAEKLKPVMSKSAATRSRAGTTLSIDNSVMDRFGNLLRCTWSWYSGRYHKVIRGQDLLGIVFTIEHIALPLHVLFCPKQGRYHTTKADLLIFMLIQLKTAFLREGIAITQFPLTMDAAYVSQALRERRHQLGFIDIIIGFLPAFGDSRKRSIICSGCPPPLRGPVRAVKATIVPRRYDDGSDTRFLAARMLQRARGRQAAPSLVRRVGSACSVVAWACARGPTHWASRARGVRRKRWPRRSRCARPNICRFSILRRLICPSTGPLLHGPVTPALTAA